MKCPKCKTVELKQSNQNSPGICSACNGMWLMNLEIHKWSEARAEQSESDSNAIDYDQKTGMCPSGHGIMIRAKVDLDEPFYLEKCTTCGGVWFDQGEWTRIAENNMAENLNNLWSQSWQRKQRQEKNRENFLQLNQKLLGDDVFNLLIDLSRALKDHPEKDRAIALLQQEII